MPGDSERPEPNINPIPTGQSNRSMIVGLDADDVGNMLRRAFVDRHGKFTINCDDLPTRGNDTERTTGLSHVLRLGSLVQVASP